MPEFRQIDCGEVSLRCAIEGPAPGTAPLAIMVHGFPESWYSWRHQLGPVADAGFTACAIDVRGYGGSDKPHPVEAYAMERLVGDLVGLRDALAPGQQVVLIGHDWGAPIVWNTAFTNTERVRAVAGLSVPFAGAPLRPFTDVFREAFTSQGRFFYQVYFQDEGVAEAELEADVRASLRQACIDQALGDHGFQILTRLGGHAGGDFLGAQFEQKSQKWQDHQINDGGRFEPPEIEHHQAKGLGPR